MLNKIILFSVKNKLVIGLFMALWIIYGLFEVSRLPIDAVPDITNNQVQIITTAPALGAQDVERLITFPIEQVMSNIPGLKESRSMSRFGLSLITIVFDDDADVYWARQQVTERLQQVDITASANKPELAPVTTGLGEIYQYVLRPQPGYESKYSLADLRTIQDWIVRRQLLGTKGVADVATFGGELKQYEVAVNPARLSSMHLTISDVFNALHTNNQNTGGAYIEKGPTVMYIRSEGLAGNVDDIENIVVKNTANGTPVLIKQIADVRLGAATRYGALTYHPVGEVSGAIVLMLKGANSSEVIVDVKQRIAEIQKTLPEGLVIDPFLDRTKMVNNAIGTVESNLLEGALIVVFVLVIFLGNLRAGLIVASVIPLAMLFAIIMMNTFGVSGNLMSLGALDFGLIVDGAVIIVEAILHHLHFSKKYANVNELSQDEMNTEVTGSASRMMNAAVFGQIIILIVYLPILSLSGIEGKMFKPMAQTVAFAILGAFILSLTYVPMISSMFISKKLSHNPNISDRVMTRIENGYQSWLTKALQFKKTMVGIAFGLFAIAVLLFTQMGGEFIPQLEEGDFAVETRLLIGTNLSTTINTVGKMSDVLKRKFPEVEKIVARVGSAEMPTDPMPIEGGDVIIVLKDKKEWTSAKSFPEMASKMSAAVQEALPGVTTSFQYPVQMRFNELMTGAKQDVVCKIFGEDLNQLARYAEQIGAISNTVDGTADLYVEKVTGMPQVVIKYNRAEIAKYGLNIDEVNRTVNAAFAGAAAGKVYEGEKSFDLVVRVGSEGRRNLSDVQNLLISTPGGSQIPLYQVAKVEEIEGPNQIQRENAKRRITVGFNVRGRDVQSIVEELQQKITSKVKLAPGYYITYGGAFENLQQAKKRLGIAVPVALVLIFVMLYFAFSSVKEGALIYTAIPLSAIGGVFALAMRGMPFSISAGVGFIALFGVAVLNGIVLISEFNRIKAEGKITDALQLVKEGTRNRLRPVLMTAAVASLGFLPMALSNGAGAEVQRPLATVVIGGLITATFLTLFVLPALYLLFNSKSKPKGDVPAGATTTVVILIALMMFAPTAKAQQTVKVSDAIQIALKHNLQVQSAELNEGAERIRQKTSFDIAKTQLSADYGQVNSISNDTKFGVTQSFSFPTVYSNQKKALQANYLSAQANARLTQQEIKAEVRRLYYQILWLGEKKKLLNYADSIYTLFEKKTSLRFKVGEANILEQATAQTHHQQIANQRNMLQADEEIALRQFNVILHDSVNYVPTMDSLRIAVKAAQYQNSAADQLPQVQFYNHQADGAKWRWKTERAKLLPDFFAGYANQSLVGSQLINGRDAYFGAGRRFNYVSAGISIPIFSGAQSARASAAKIEWQMAQKRTDMAVIQLQTEMQNALQQVNKYAVSLNYYENQGNKNANLIISTADKQFGVGDINYLQWVILVDQAISIKSEYLETLNNYNQAAIQLQQLNNQ
ncbi:CusA/CzcA family heavy metal efflux RND transporter [Mucilaginibacter myungsuensis]|uniref:CusA/CzcA family heavy metal efflux RND transporter n=1 Tax=Mucilaginibacter myungsuensis TaxID=649104 RepID=A0A929KXV3_9SPHI|nr:CusA/CzcA family heavy metal efflux RND transporter [Mucilaginibacter myungsuensis]MBE9662657.1 CusA/CzcA family heavy metal efflux RND transporter [Mucilaginibacter myungsuensis]MDN3598077.1 CusA/CzcA family heavy metal efflux RND transporter [Mucilaginibacter myungsuensis]